MSPTLYFRSRIGVLNLSVAAMVSLEVQGIPGTGIPVPVGDAAVIAVGGKQRHLGAGCGFHPPDDEPHRCSFGLALEGSVDSLCHVGGAVHPIGMGVHSSSGMASIRLRGVWCWRTVMEQRTFALRQTATMAWLRWRGCRSRCRLAW